MKKHFPVLIEQDSNGVFIVECPIFKGCRSYGHTIEEAINNIIEAVGVCIEDEPSENATTIFIGIRDIEVAVA